MTGSERNKAAVRGAIEALNKQDLDLFFSFHTEDTTSHEVYFPEPLQRDQFRDFLQQFLSAYPDVYIDTKKMVCEGDTVVVENVMTGTFTNDLGETRATGRSCEVREAVFFELENGKIKAARIYQDLKSLEAQLGLS